MTKKLLKDKKIPIYSFSAYDRIYIALKRSREREKRAKERARVLRNNMKILWDLYKNVK